MKSQLIGKGPDAGKDRGQEKWVTDDEMIRCHHRLDGQEFEQTLVEVKDRKAMCAAVHEDTELDMT